jgi:hypothetical protein
LAVTVGPVVPKILVLLIVKEHVPGPVHVAMLVAPLGVL